ncbi:MAG: D-aminoacylase [Gemmataceae bacterium]|nr:D-aminoacylase [Gemmataceae bacterium]
MELLDKALAVRYPAFSPILPPESLAMSAFIAALLTLAAADAPVTADHVIRGATLYDGSGKPGIKGDLAIRGEKIVAVGTFDVAGRPKIIDGTGLIVAPGFIDLHTHSDIPIFVPGSRQPITEPATRANLNYLLQGVTTIVTGNCGFGPVDVATYLKEIETSKVGTNVAHQVPHNDLRRRVMGNVNRAPTAAELAKMKELVEKGMKDGAWGFSTGLMYTPGSYARTDELVELAKVAAAQRGFYASHMRDEGADVLTSINETLDIGKRAGLPVHISHLKSRGPKGWGKSGDAIALIEQARKQGQAVTADQYPYTAASTMLAAVAIPAIYREGGLTELQARLDDAELGPKVRASIDQLIKEEWQDGKALMIASYPKRVEWQGQDLAAIASKEKKPVRDLVIEIERNGGATVVIFAMKEEDVRLIMKSPFVAAASDGSTNLPAAAPTHPRSYGTFPRRIGHYAIQEKVLSLEQAIRSASGLPADILRLPERGYLKVGHYADVVVFDPETFRDRATFDRSHEYATGVRFLFVNGVLTIADGRYTATLSGKALRHQ